MYVLKLFSYNQSKIDSFLKLKPKLIIWDVLQVVNHHLLRDLTERDLWDDEMKNQMIASNGSIQVTFTFSELIGFTQKWSCRLML